MSPRTRIGRRGAAPRCGARRDQRRVLLALALAAAFGAGLALPVLATNFTAEGEATAHVIGQALKSRGLTVTRLARGVPAGSELEYVDLGTIAHALVDRR